MGMSLRAFQDLNRHMGLHWFDSPTMRFFGSRLSNWEHDTGYFISSEKGPRGKRRYTIRKAIFETGMVCNIGEFQQYPSLYMAKIALAEILRKERNEKNNA